jgi:opacity protein-like surface antigen
MNRFAKFALTAVFAVLTAAGADAQQKSQTQPAQKVPTVPDVQGQQGVYHGGIGQTPWFSNQEIRQHFKLSDQQYDQLNKSYSESYGRYQQGMKTLGKDLSNEQRIQKMRDLQQGFNKDFSTTTNQVFTDPQQRQRYNQLYLQYQGYNAFSDPLVQEKLIDCYVTNAPV